MTQMKGMETEYRERREEDKGMKVMEERKNER
jgi:hypothetical protein